MICASIEDSENKPCAATDMWFLIQAKLYTREGAASSTNGAGKIGESDIEE